MEVTLINKDIEAGVTIHWHGYNVPNAMDGVAGMTQDAVQVGEQFTYRFKANDEGTYWYHSHQQSSEQVKRGLFGSFVVLSGDEEGKANEITSIGVNWLFDGKEAIVSDGHDQGFVKKRMSTGSDVRLRLINTTNHTKTYFIEGSEFKIAAIDGQFIHKPQDLKNTKLELGAGGRYDVIFTMPDKPVLIKTSGYSQQGKTDAQLLLSQDGQGSVPLISAEIQSFKPEEYGESLQTPFDLSSDFDREFTMVLGQRFGFYDGKPNYLWTINGEVFPNTSTMMVKEGDLVKTTFVNKRFMDHPMHVHGHHMLVLSKNGKPVTGSPWWTDTLNVVPGKTYEVAFLANNPGMWMDHCHNLDHAAVGMTMHLSYEGVSSPFSIGRDTLNQPE